MDKLYWFLIIGSIFLTGTIIGLRLIFRQTVLFSIASILVIYGTFWVAVGFVISDYGFLHLTWLAPLGCVLLAVIAIVLNKQIRHPLKELIKKTAILAKGNTTVRIERKVVKNKYELGEISRSFNQLIDGITAAVAFSSEIRNGNFDADYKLLSDDDTLGISLMKMRDSLAEAQRTEEKRKEEDEKRNWATQGIAKFGELLRKSSTDISETGFTILNNLVEYTDAAIAGLYFLNDDNPDDQHLEQIACYAYDRNKYLTKRIELREGIVGMCAVEKKLTHLTEIPDNYIEISSGLGKASPRSLLAIPLISDDTLLGVLEIASFNTFEDYQIEFIERVCQNIASSLLSTKINMRTNRLLQESEMQKQQMKEKEEEMRQNMEELRATQEEMQRQRKELETENTKLSEDKILLEQKIVELARENRELKKENG